MESGAATDVLAELRGEPLSITNVVDKTQINSALQDYANIYDLRKQTGMSQSGGLMLANALLSIAMHQTSSDPADKGG